MDNPKESREQLKVARVSSGVPKLDKMLNGGFPPGTVILLAGDAGTGKTLFGLNFLLNGVANGGRGCYISLNEDREGLVRATQEVAPLRRVENHLDKNLAFENIILGGKITLEYFTKMFANYPKIDRLVIDNVNKLLIFAENKRDYRLHLGELVRFLKQRIGCTLLICETESGKQDSGNGEAFEVDGVVKLGFSEFEEKPLRTIEILKMRYTPIEPRVKYNFVINRDGLKVESTKIV